MYIYLITNLYNCKVYVGFTRLSIEQRWKEHIRKSKIMNYHLSKAIRKYGHECFIIETIEKVNDINLLKKREIFWINYFDSYNNGYNMTKGGDGVINYKFDPIIVEKIAAMKRGKKQPPGANLKRSLALKGKPKPYSFGLKQIGNQRARKPPISY